MTIVRTGGFMVTDMTKIKFDKRNYRKHDDENKRLIRKSLEECGAGRSVVIDNEGELIAGNGVYEQAQALGLKIREVETDGSELVVVKRTDIATDDEKRRLLAMADNATSDTSEFDFDLLGEDFEVEELKEWGIEVPAIEDEEDAPEATEDDFDEDKDEVEAQVKKGEVYQLGDHRLMCGDSTKAEDVSKLMGGGKADIAFASPPYNAGFGANLTKKNGRSKYTNGDADNKTRNEYSDFLCKYISNANEHSKFNFCNIQLLSNNKLSIFDMLAKNVDVFADVEIWDKTRSQPQLDGNVLNSEFEFVFIFSQNANRAIGTIPFHGTLKNIVHISPTRNEYSEIHNAVFPIELPAYHIKNFAKESVLDLFGGTGTTLIACEQLKRKCFMMEFDPHYCDVIIARWEKLTGKKAIKIED